MKGGGKNIRGNWRYFIALSTLFLSCLYVLHYPHSLSPLALQSEQVPPTIQTSGVLDRILPTGHGLILLESMNLQIIAPKESLPEGIQPSMYVTLLLMEDEFVIKDIDYPKTKEQMKLSKELQEKLKDRSHSR